MSAERVTYRPEGSKRARSIYLSDPRTSEMCGHPVLIGEEVDRDGLPVLPLGKDGKSTRMHIIQEELIVRRVPVVMDNTYGEFVEEDR